MSDTRPKAGLLDRPYLLLTLATLQWSANTIAGRLAVGEIAPMLLTTLRWLIVSVVLMVVLRRDFREDWVALRARPWLLLLLGSTGYTGFAALLYLAAHYTTAANMAIIQGAMPLFVFSLAFAVRGRPIGLAQAIGMALALFGVVVVATRGDLAVLAALDFNVGDIFMVLATVCYAVYTVGLESRPVVRALSFFTMAVTAAFVTSVPLAIAEAATVGFAWPTAKGWLLTVLIAVFPSFLAQVFFIRGVELIGPGRAGIFINLIPVFGAGMAVAFLGEPFGWYQGAGLVMVMAGIVFAQR